MAKRDQKPEPMASPPRLPPERTKLEALPPTKQPAAPAGSGRQIHRRKDGRELTRATVYLPEPLARRLGAYAGANGLEHSTILATALERYLEQLGV